MNKAVLAALLLGATGAAAQNVTTYHGDPARSGHYVVPDLTYAKAAGVHRDAGFNAAVEGAVYGQPLYWAPTNAVIVATQKNFVYALNANTGAELWRTHLGTPVPLSALPCGDINPMGLTGTPVIDPTTGIVYLEAYIQTSAGPRHQVFGLSVATGALASGWPVDVANGLTGRTFANKPQGQRSALSLLNGNLYVPYAGHYGDCSTYNGMVVGVTLASPHVFGAWSTSVAGGGSWGQSGIAFDGTDMFVTTGNTFTAPTTAWGGGEAVIRLPQSLADPTGNTANYFAPSNWQALDEGDLDLGGTSAIPIDISTTPRMLALGKDGNAYLLDRGNLGGIGHPIAIAPVSSDKIRTAMASYPTAGAVMVAFQGEGSSCPSGQSGNLVMLKVTPSAVAAAWCHVFGGNGLPIVTTTTKTADPIVWVVGARDSGPNPSSGDGRLYAFEGSNGRLLASVPGGGAAVGRLPFLTLLHANGHFYVGANGAVYAFAY
jgi:outer membrane protein assembly factor BamB